MSVAFGLVLNGEASAICSIARSKRAASISPRPLAFAFGRQNVRLEHEVEPLQLDVAVEPAVALHQCGDRRRGVLDRLLESAHVGAQKALCRVRFLGEKFRAGQDRAAVELKPVVRHQHEGEVVGRHAFFPQGDRRAVGDAGDSVDLAGGQHRLPHRNADVQDRHLGGIDAVELGEDRPRRGCRIESRRAELLLFEVLRLHDPAASARDDAVGGPIVNDENRLGRNGWILVAPSHQCVDVADAHIEAAGRQAGERLLRIGGWLDREVEAFVLEVAAVEAEQEWCGGRFETAVEGELDRNLGVPGGDRQCGRESGRRDHGGSGPDDAYAHTVYPSWRHEPGAAATSPRGPAHVAVSTAKNMPHQRASRRGDLG